MENKILFLIMAILGLYLVFTEKGQTWLKKYLGIVVSNTSSSSSSTSTSNTSSSTSTAKTNYIVNGGSR